MIYIILFLFAFMLLCRMNVSNAVIFFWVALILVPSGLMLFPICGINILMGEMLLLLFYIYKQNKDIVIIAKKKHGIFIASVVFSFALFVLFSSSVPIISQLKSYIAEFFYIFFTIVVFYYFKNNLSITSSLFNYFLFAIVLNMLWSVSYEILQGYNPTTELIDSLFGDDVAVEMLNESRGGFSFRIQSIFSHPLSLGQIFLFLMPIVKYSNKKYANVILFFLFLFILMSGTRGAIVPALVLLCFYYMSKFNFQRIIMLICGMIILWGCLSPSLKMEVYDLCDNVTTLIAFWDSNRTENISGSSLSMRYDQLVAAFKEIENNYLFGMGKGYREFYQNLHGTHPKLLGYESLVLLILVERGIIGLIFYLYCLYYIAFRLFKVTLKDKLYIITFFLFLISAIMTGIRQYYILLFGFNAIIYYQSKVRKRLANNYEISNNIHNNSCL